MFHPTDEDPVDHLTVDMKDANGNHITTKHIAKDRAQQKQVTVGLEVDPALCLGNVKAGVGLFEWQCTWWV